MIQLKKTNTYKNAGNLVLLVNKNTSLQKHNLSEEEQAYVKKQLADKKSVITLNRYTQVVFVVSPELKKDKDLTINQYRKAGADVVALSNRLKLDSLTVVDVEGKSNEALAFTEGVMLGNYQFLKYRKDAEKEKNTLTHVFLHSKKINDKAIQHLIINTQAVYEARTLVNEPVIYLTAEQLAKEFQRLGREAGFSVNVLNKAKIESLKMGGLLAVNYGSKQPPTFTIMEWKPRGAKNKKPIVLVGKGVVYDTGGLSLKPTAGSMDTMKCDMAGAAAVGATMYAVAKAKLPVHVIALVPATDNRPGEIAYTPGDVIHMHNGLTVEVLNTDAEGRMI